MFFKAPDVAYINILRLFRNERFSIGIFLHFVNKLCDGTQNPRCGMYLSFGIWCVFGTARETKRQKITFLSFKKNRNMNPSV